MNDRNTGSGGGGSLYFIVGALVVVVAVIGFYLLNDGWPGGDNGDIDVDVTQPNATDVPSDGGSGDAGGSDTASDGGSGDAGSSEDGGTQQQQGSE